MLWLLKLVSPISAIAKEIARVKTVAENGKTDQARIAARERVSTLEAELVARQANRALGGRMTAWVQFVWAAPFILYNAKLIIWDKMLKLGVTDPLSGDLMDLQLRIVTFYFGGVAAIGVVRAIRG